MTIKKVKTGYRLVSKKGKNLGTFRSSVAALDSSNTPTVPESGCSFYVSGLVPRLGRQRSVGLRLSSPRQCERA